MAVGDLPAGFVVDQQQTQAQPSTQGSSTLPAGFVVDGDTTPTAQPPTKSGMIDMSGYNFTGNPKEALSILNLPVKKTIGNMINPGQGTSFEQDAINKTGQPGYVPQPTTRPFDANVSGAAGRALQGKAFNDVTQGQEEDLLSTPSMLAGAGAKLGPEMEAAYNAGKYNSVLSAHTDAYRKILNPGKNIINSTNVDVNNASKTLAQEGVVIKTDVNRKLDNTDGIKQLQDANKPLYDQANQILESSPDKQFDLRKIGFQAKVNAGKYIKNAEQRIAAKKQVDTAINAEISENGGNHMVNAPTVYRIKQGMYERAYNPLEPTSNDGARAIGSTIKDQVEKAFPESPIREINQKIGNRLQAQTLLEKTNGNVVQGGKLGQGVGRVIGGGVGALVGSHIPIPGAAELGALGGQDMGARAVNYMNDPERLTTAMANKIKGLRNPEIPNTTRSGVVTPEIVNPNRQSMPINGRPSIGSGVRPIGIQDKSWMDMNDPRNMKIPQGSAVSENPIPMRGATASTTNKINIAPKSESFNGNQQPNIRAQVDMSKGGTPVGKVAKKDGFSQRSVPKSHPMVDDNTAIDSAPKNGTDNANLLYGQMRAKENIPLHPAEEGRAFKDTIYAKNTPEILARNMGIKPEQVDHLADIKGLLESSEGGTNQGFSLSGGMQGERTHWYTKSNVPDSLKGKYTQNEIADMLDKKLNGDKVTPGQSLVIKKLLKHFFPQS